MSLTDRFLRWYQKYITEITWFLIGNVVLQFAEALERQHYIDAFFCVLVCYLNYSIWYRNRRL
jgi:hypothetical protein